MAKSRFRHKMVGTLFAGGETPSDVGATKRKIGSFSARRIHQNCSHLIHITAFSPCQRLEIRNQRKDRQEKILNFIFVTTQKILD